MKKIILLSLTLLFVQIASAQDVMDPFKPNTDVPIKMNDVYDKQHHTNRANVMLAPLREADVMWSRKIWREIDLRQTQNMPLYYPQAKSAKDRTLDRYNLFDVLYRAALGEDGRDGDRIRVFGNAEWDDEFQKMPMTKAEIEDEVLGPFAEVGNILETWDGLDSVDVNNNPVYDDPERKAKFDKRDVKKWLIKEQWFFDKQRSVMDVRIIGLCPVVDKRADGSTGELTGEETRLFWFYFPETRTVLKNSLAFNLAKNEAENKTFEDIFMKRQFASTITKEGNVMDRSISDYMIGLDAVLEAQRIKENIFNIEHDLWEY